MIVVVTVDEDENFLVALFRDAVNDGRSKHAGTLAERLNREYGKSLDELARVAGVKPNTLMGWFYLWFRLDRKSKSLVGLGYDHEENNPLGIHRRNRVRNNTNYTSSVKQRLLG